MGFFRQLEPVVDSDEEDQNDPTAGEPRNKRVQFTVGGKPVRSVGLGAFGKMTDDERKQYEEHRWKSAGGVWPNDWPPDRRHPPQGSCFYCRFLLLTYPASPFSPPHTHNNPQRASFSQTDHPLAGGRKAPRLSSSTRASITSEASKVAKAEAAAETAEMLGELEATNRDLRRRLATAEEDLAAANALLLWKDAAFLTYVSTRDANEEGTFSSLETLAQLQVR